MKENGKKIASALLAAALLAAAPAAGVCGKISASANSAPAYWYGSDGTGVMPAKENCPVEVEREHLTLEISTLPQTSYSSQEEFDGYNARFTAEYTFYNPTDEALSVELAFPFGTAPEYIYDRSQGDGRTLFNDSARYGVTVGGEEAETELRYTYSASALTLPAEKKREEGLLKEDAPLYEFSYAASAGADLYNGNYYIEVRLSYSPARSRILCEHYRDYLLEDGDLILLLYLNGEADRFYAIGEKPQIKHAKVALQSGGLYSGERTYIEDAQIETSEKSSTFGTWVGETRPEGIGEVDWYNAAVACLESYGTTAFGLSFGSPSSLSEEDLMRWMIYTLEIPAKGRVVNAVTGPLYPDVTHNSYRYTYLLSPAQAWAKFGTFSLTIATPYTLEECRLSLEETEGGFAFTREGLPLGELEFSIRQEGEGYKASPSKISRFLLVVPLAIIAFNLLGLSIGLAVHFGLRAREKKKAKK